jgi:sterol 3beta-glucosyltransferase
MKVLILTFGTRGDMQPFVALARELRDRGHVAVLAAPERFRGLAAAHGVDLVAVDDGPLALMGGIAGAAVAGGARAKLRLARAMPASFARIFDDCAEIALAGAGRGADVVVHNGQIIAAPHVAERLGVPCVLALAAPIYVPTRAFPWPGAYLPGGLPGPVNRASYLGMRGPAAMFAGVVDRWRTRTLGLPRRSGRHDPLRAPDGTPTPVLHAVSRHVVPPPPDWPASVTTTGYWFLPAAERTLPRRVEDFLAAGTPPVLVGFGSMAGADPATTTRTVLDAARSAGIRGILATGWGGLTPADVPASILLVDEVPHDLLLPHTAAVVHHGGAGTTAAAAAAGRPQVVCPFVADQPFWGRRVHALGLGPAPLPQRRLTADELAQALRTAVDDPTIHATAARLGAQITREAGTATTVTALEKVAATV